ncbi:hypothetical protein EDS67_28445 [candidate division KSB1 bacterium]|nr:MAG: hypothetical protein EDS67_28445 [candidate division KSB1 bacterium]MBC6948757.1 hypothetical protein [candidate division KSB1 bacterium]MCE7945534.1 hypothetical protein [Chlorobi bacterium CHB1]MDL1878004.1 hypothetical protein [Cytophagia bacterium CHB2]
MADKPEIDIALFLGPAHSEELQKVIDAISASASFAILESLTDISFPAPQAGEIKLTEWERGRLFAEAFELRWEKTGEKFRCVLAAEKEDWKWPQADFELKKSFTSADHFLQDYFADAGREEYSVYLWPETDSRLGRQLHYACLDATRPKTSPNEKSPNAKLQIKRYFDAHGRLIFWRYKSMRWES